jgi:hypothetical protein
MKCEECGGDTKVTQTLTLDDVVHRMRHCKDPKCKWRCVSQERYVDEYYDINSLRKRAQQENSND